MAKLMLFILILMGINFVWGSLGVLTSAAGFLTGFKDKETNLGGVAGFWTGCWTVLTLGVGPGGEGGTLAGWIRNGDEVGKVDWTGFDFLVGLIWDVDWMGLTLEDAESLDVIGCEAGALAGLIRDDVEDGGVDWTAFDFLVGLTWDAVAEVDWMGFDFLADFTWDEIEDGLGFDLTVGTST